MLSTLNEKKTRILQKFNYGNRPYFVYKVKM
jgi:hypothetical protein